MSASKAYLIPLFLGIALATLACSDSAEEETDTTVSQLEGEEGEGMDSPSPDTSEGPEEPPAPCPKTAGECTVDAPEAFGSTGLVLAKA